MEEKAPNGMLGKAIVIAVAIAATLPAAMLTAPPGAGGGETLGRVFGASLPAIVVGFLSLRRSRAKGRQGTGRAIAWTVGVAILCSLALARQAAA